MSSAGFKPGDLVTCNYEGVGDGVVYRVVEVTGQYTIKVKPIFSCFPGMDVKKRKTRDIGAGWCTKLSLDDLRNTKHELEALIGGEMNRDPRINPMAESARKMKEIRKTVDDEDSAFRGVFCSRTSDCACGCNR